ncbi:MAG: thymidylate kinase [Bacteroidaceae bacterium]|nr:thymidylate kinase [Bacteroidaceae bacterium]
MATYTITVNERTNGGKALMAYLRDLGVLVESRKTVKKSSYMQSKEDVRKGNVESFANSEDLFQSLGI